MLINLFGFLLPLEWVLGIVISFTVLLVLVAFLFVTRGDSKAPIDKRIVLTVPIDEAGIMQRGKFLGNASRTETELVFADPEWVDEENNAYQARCPIEKKIPFNAKDDTGGNVELWVVRDKGDLDVVSASQLMGNVPTRYDVLPASPKKLFEPLMPWGRGGGIEEVIANKNFWAILIPTIIACLAVGHII